MAINLLAIVVAAYLQELQDRHVEYLGIGCNYETDALCLGSCCSFLSRFSILSIGGVVDESIGSMYTDDAKVACDIRTACIFSVGVILGKDVLLIFEIGYRK